MDDNEFLNRRVQSDLVISEELYIEGLLDVTQLLCFELEKYLEKEERYFGIALSYMNSINGAFQRISVSTSEDNYEIYGKILYLYKPLILREFRKLERRKLSEADCIIVILKRILDVLLDLEENKFEKETKTIGKIITKFYDNIRNFKKVATLSGLTSSIREFESRGLVGKYPLDHFSIEEEEERRKKSKFEGEKTKIDEKKKGTGEGWEIDL